MIGFGAAFLGEERRREFAATNHSALPLVVVVRAPQSFAISQVGASTGEDQLQQEREKEHGIQRLQQQPSNLYSDRPEDDVKTGCGELNGVEPWTACHCSQSATTGCTAHCSLEVLGCWIDGAALPPSVGVRRASEAACSPTARVVGRRASSAAAPSADLSSPGCEAAGRADPLDGAASSCTRQESVDALVGGTRRYTRNLSGLVSAASCVQGRRHSAGGLPSGAEGHLLLSLPMQAAGEPAAAAETSECIRPKEASAAGATAATATEGSAKAQLQLVNFKGLGRTGSTRREFRRLDSPNEGAGLPQQLPAASLLRASEKESSFAGALLALLCSDPSCFCSLQVTLDRVFLQPYEMAAIQATLQNRPALHRGFHHVQPQQAVQLPLAFQLHVCFAAAMFALLSPAAAALGLSSFYTHMLLPQGNSKNWRSFHGRIPTGTDSPTCAAASPAAAAPQQGGPMTAAACLPDWRLDSSGLPPRPCFYATRHQGNNLPPLSPWQRQVQQQRQQQQKSQQQQRTSVMCTSQKPQGRSSQQQQLDSRPLFLPSVASPTSLGPAAREAFACSSARSEASDGLRALLLQEPSFTHQVVEGRCVLRLFSVEASPSALHSGACRVGDRLEQQLRLHNPSSQLPLDVYLEAQHPFRCHPASSQLLPQQQQDFKVVFAPQRLGPIKQRLIVLFCR
ncbi:hypothetical protein Efla_004156 [Eimeria flavescens]